MNAPLKDLKTILTSGFIILKYQIRNNDTIKIVFRLSISPLFTQTSAIVQMCVKDKKIDKGHCAHCANSFKYLDKC